MKASNIGNYFEDFKEGEIINHQLSKTIFESDNNFFSLLTMNHHPIHTNIDFASRTEFSKPLVVGTLVISITVGITVPDISGKAIANLSYDHINHLHPVFIGDTIYARTKILKIRESKSRPGSGIVSVETTAYNQYKVDVLVLRRNVLIAKRENEE